MEEPDGIMAQGRSETNALVQGIRDLLRKWHVAAGLFAMLFSGAVPAKAETAQFDLAGPSLDVTVSRGGQTLPIAAVPTLAPGDRISVSPRLTTQTSAHYLIVLSFLRSAVSPPQDRWFTRLDSWRPDAGTLIAEVPKGATRAVLFLVPAKRGDFATLRGAVQGQPGAFLRAGHNLALASLDRQRLNTYLDQLGQLAASGSNDVGKTASVLAANLRLKLDEACLARPRDEQIACLGEKGDELVLDDGHSSTLAEAIAGPGADLAQQVTASSGRGLGSFNPYVGLIREIAGLFSSIHTPKFQYIPALTLANGAGLDLLLNRAPSFHSPRSVIMAALPIVEDTPVGAPIATLTKSAAICVQAVGPQLPVTLSPLFYATGYAHDMNLVARLKDGREIRIPLVPDIRHGGLAMRMPANGPSDLPIAFNATITGKWGFDAFSGPELEMQSAGAWRWRADAAGSGGAVSFSGDAPACVSSVAVSVNGAQPEELKWHSTDSGAVAIDLPTGVDRNGGVAKFTIAGPGGILPETLKVQLPKPGQPELRLIAIDVEPAARGQNDLKITTGNSRLIESDATVRLSVGVAGKSHFNAGSKFEFEADLDGTDKLTATTDASALLDPSSAIVSIQPMRLLGPGAFGRLRMRTRLDGRDSLWLDLGTLVRMPRLASFVCPSQALLPCQLGGERLYLISAASADAGFGAATNVPFATLAHSIAVPRPDDGRLYLRLHDAPDAEVAVALVAPANASGKE